MAQYGNPALEKSYTKIGNFNITPKGIIIIDSYNNPWYPMESAVLDTSQFNTYLLWDEYKKKYSNVSSSLFFPWHYMIELIHNEPYVLQTRPLTYKSLIPDYEEYISICLVGNSYNDVYSPRYYKKIADICINPLRAIPGWRMNLQLNKTIHLINIGESFVPDILERYLKG